MLDVTEGVTWCDCQVISGRCSAETPQQWPLSATDAAKMKRCGSCGSPLEAINGKWNELVVKLTPMHTCILLGWKRERAAPLYFSGAGAQRQTTWISLNSSLFSWTVKVNHRGSIQPEERLETHTFQIKAKWHVSPPLWKAVLHK